MGAYNNSKNTTPKQPFFALEITLKNIPKFLKKLLNEGHSIGNHTFNHLNGWKTSEKYFENTKKCESEVQFTI
jgi:hypothetical protein